jgi:SAM-dependent methyltransferase
MDNLEPKPSATEVVKTFYDRFGWKIDGERSGEDRLFRAFPKAHGPYGIAVERRTLATLKCRRGSLLFVGCGDLPKSHLNLSNQFDAVHCIDISETALSIARQKLRDKGAFYCDSIVETELPDNLVDAAFCAHVIYHIDKDQQERAVRQIIRITKPGGRAVIIYANPRTVFAFPGEVMRHCKWLRGRKGSKIGAIPDLYYHAHPLSWWSRFNDVCEISYLPWEIIGSRPARTLLRGDSMAKVFYNVAEQMETLVPRLTARLWQYAVVILDKRK